MKLPNFTRLLYGVGENRQHKNFLFLFLNLDTVPSDSTANFWQIKWHWIRSIKFETVRIHFLSDVFGLYHPEIFATMATWRNNFFSLSRGQETHADAVESQSLATYTFLLPRGIRPYLQQTTKFKTLRFKDHMSEGNDVEALWGWQWWQATAYACVPFLHSHLQNP